MKLAWAMAGGTVIVMTVGLVLLLHGASGPWVRDVVPGPLPSAGMELFGYVLLTNGRTVLWCLVGWVTAGFGSLVVGSMALAILVFSFEIGFVLVERRVWLVFGIHASLEFLACGLAVAAGLFPMFAVVIQNRRSGGRPGVALRSYRDNIVRAVPVALISLGLIVVGAVWEGFVAPQLR